MIEIVVCICPNNKKRLRILFYKGDDIFLYRDIGSSMREYYSSGHQIERRKINFFKENIRYMNINDPYQIRTILWYLLWDKDTIMEGIFNYADKFNFGIRRINIQPVKKEKKNINKDINKDISISFL